MANNYFAIMSKALLFVCISTGEQWSYTNWADGQPAGSCGIFCGSGDCVLMRSTKGYKWIDYPCASSLYHYYFVCEYGEFVFSLTKVRDM